MLYGLPVLRIQGKMPAPLFQNQALYPCRWCADDRLSLWCNRYPRYDKRLSAHLPWWSAYDRPERNHRVVCLWRSNYSSLFSDIILDKPLYFRNYTVFCLFKEERIDGEGCISNFLFAPYWRGEFVFKGSIFLHRLTPFIVCKLISNKRGKTDGCWHSSTGV